MIDVIVPCYYSADIVRPCLTSIVNQTIIDQVRLILVNDCSPNTTCEYKDIIEEFKDRVPITYLKTASNGGPGIARQLGLDSATADWVMFVDDDDELYDEYALEELLKRTHAPDRALVGGASTICRNPAPEFIQKAWGHPQGSLYNRKVLAQCNIRFDPRLSFLEEDGAFGDMVRCYTSKYTHHFIRNLVYLKKNTDDHLSVTARHVSSINFINVIGHNALRIKYKYENNILDYNEQITVVANVLDYLTHKLTYPITQQQYDTLVSFLDEIAPIVTTYEEPAAYQSSIDAYNEHYSNGFLGTFTYDSIIGFFHNKEEWLRELQERI